MSAIGCFAMFRSEPQLMTIYDCIENLQMLNKQSCDYKVTIRNTTKIKVVTKCCYEDKCNVESLIEKYFPKKRK